MQNSLTKIRENVPAVNDYNQLSLIELTSRIAQSGDKKALTELHQNRDLFRFKDSRALVIVDFLVKLKNQPQSRRWCNNNQIILEKAFDLTLSKFLNIPDKNSNSSDKPETNGPDCRYYYKAYNGRVLSDIQSKNLSDELEIEFMAAKLLQNLVFRHFYLSCLECRRVEQKFIRRICYQYNSQNLYLWIPCAMTSKMFKKWFNQNITNGCGQQDIQELIDSSLFSGKLITLQSLDSIAKQNIEADVFPALIKEQITTDGLARTVADEKADNIDYQRPAIKSLGRAILKKLILRIFTSLAESTNDYQSILSDFGLSKATFSRFAGTRWTNNNGSQKQVSIPDLWKNTAQILAHHPDFTEAVKKAGLWKNVCLAAENIN
ncbi:MAG: hypothetical protein ISS77_02535 [Phycisphaerae bacterium]|nr:hypothetical protein [Planctomycetota bacterium]MBL7106473.1 hypothetical protein [Phycisphaerae bacterium]